MRAGQLNRMLRLQKVVMTSDSEGVSSEAWTDVAKIWAHISPAGAREIFNAAQTEVHITHQITIRWRPAVSDKMRFLYVQPQGTRIFLIHTMLDADEAHRQLDCMAEEIVTTQLGSV